jgi:hypothetical protein
MWSTRPFRKAEWKTWATLSIWSSKEMTWRRVTDRDHCCWSCLWRAPSNFLASPKSSFKSSKLPADSLNTRNIYIPVHPSLIQGRESEWKASKDQRNMQLKKEVPALARKTKCNVRKELFRYHRGTSNAIFRELGISMRLGLFPIYEPIFRGELCLFQK